MADKARERERENCSDTTNHEHLYIRTDGSRAIGWGMNKAPPGVNVRPQTKGATNLYGMLGVENQSACVPFFLPGIDGSITAAACSSACSAILSCTSGGLDISCGWFIVWRTSEGQFTDASV